MSMTACATVAACTGSRFRALGCSMRASAGRASRSRGEPGTPATSPSGPQSSPRQGSPLGPRYVGVHRLPNQAIRRKYPTGGRAMLTKVRRWGNSQGLRVTRALLDEAGIHVGDEVEVSAGRGRIISSPLIAQAGRPSSSKRHPRPISTRFSPFWTPVCTGCRRGSGWTSRRSRGGCSSSGPSTRGSPSPATWKGRAGMFTAAYIRIQSQTLAHTGDRPCPRP